MAFAGVPISRLDNNQNRMRQRSPLTTAVAASATCVQWVARGITGNRLSNTHPYLQHPPSQQQLLSGYPVPVYCCWNGLAILRAEPLHQGLHFRTHQPGECRASECSLLCDDYHRLGFSHVVMDPAVQVAYDFDQVKLLEWPSAGAHPHGQPRKVLVSTSGATSSEAHSLLNGEPPRPLGNEAGVLGCGLGSGSWEGTRGCGDDMQLTSFLQHAHLGAGPALKFEGVPIGRADLRSGPGLSRRHGNGYGKGVGGNASHVTRSMHELAGAGIGSSSSIRVIPFLTWEDVAGVSASLRGEHNRLEIQQQQGGGARGKVMVECCDLQPGENYVNFTADCHWMDVFAVNFTASVLAG